MSYERRGFELYLDGWELDEVGQIHDDPLSVVVELIYPRPRISSRRETQAIPPRTGEKVDWSDRPFHSRILFKELVEGPFSLGITVKRNESEKGLFDAFGTMVHEAGEEAAEEIADRFTPPSLSAALEVLAESGLEQIDVDFSDVVATGSVELNSSDERIDEKLTVELTSPVTVYNPRPNPHPERHSDYEEILKEPGDANGTMELTFSVFDR